MNEANAAMMWVATLANLRRYVTRETHRMLVEETAALRIEEGVLVLAASARAAEFLERIMATVSRIAVRRVTLAASPCPAVRVMREPVAVGVGWTDGDLIQPCLYGRGKIGMGAS